MANHTVQSSHQHPSDVLLQQYVSGALSPSEAHKVERHCLSCEACGAALSGLEELAEKGALQAIDELPGPRLSNSNRSSSSPPLGSSSQKKYTWAIAAAIGLLLVGMWFMRQQHRTEPTVASNASAYDTMAPAVFTENEPVTTAHSTEKTAQQTKPQPEATTDSGTVSLSNKAAEPLLAAEAELPKKPSTSEKVAASDAEKDDMRNETLLELSRVMPVDQLGEIDEVAPSARSAQVEDAIGPASLNNSSPPRDLKKSNIEQDFKNLNTAKQLLSSGDYLRCERTLGRIISHGVQSPVYEEARFLQARLMLHQNKLEEARTIFESLKNAGGKMSQEASTELDKMGR